MPIATVSPVTGETLQEFKELDHAEVDARIALAHETFLSYRLTLVRRSGPLAAGERRPAGRWA